MSSTRHAAPGNPYAYEKYLSATEFAEVRPIPGNAVLEKALLYTDPAVREMAFFLQAMSMRIGGLRLVAKELVDWFPERCREDDSECANNARAFAEFAALMALSEADAIDKSEALSLSRRTVGLLSDFLVELLINPKVSLTSINAPCFLDLGSALKRYKEVKEKAVWDGFVVTAAGSAVSDTLGESLRLSRMVVVEGMAGAGKSTNAKAWCAARSGLARYVSLTGITNRSTLFQKIGTASWFV